MENWARDAFAIAPSGTSWARNALRGSSRGAGTPVATSRSSLNVFGGPDRTGGARQLRAIGTIGHKARTGGATCLPVARAPWVDACKQRKL